MKHSIFSNFIFFVIFTISLLGCKNSIDAPQKVINRSNRSRITILNRSNSTISLPIITETTNSVDSLNLSDEETVDETRCIANSAIIQQLSCVDPDIVDKVTNAQVISIESVEIFPHLENFVNSYGTADQMNFLNSQSFVVPEHFYYIYNFQEAGFAVYCLDQRVPDGLMFYSNDGYLESEDLSLDGIENIIFPRRCSSHRELDDFFNRYDSTRYNITDEPDTIRFRAIDLFNYTIYALTYCTTIDYIDDCICNYNCNSYTQTFTQEYLHWNQNAPFNHFCFPHLTGSIPLTIVKVLSYLDYSGDILDFFFNSDAYKQGQNMIELYNHINRIGNYVQNVYCSSNTRGNTNLGYLLLQQIFGTDNVTITDFTSWDINTWDIIDHLNNGDVVIRIAEDDWQLVTAITFVEPYNSNSTCVCDSHIFYTTDRSKYSFCLASDKIEEMWIYGYPNYIIGDSYKYIVINNH